MTTTTTSRIDTLTADLDALKTKRDALNVELMAHPERRGTDWYNDRITAVMGVINSTMRLDDLIYSLQTGRLVATADGEYVLGA